VEHLFHISLSTYLLLTAGLKDGVPTTIYCAHTSRRSAPRSCRAPSSELRAPSSARFFFAELRPGRRSSKLLTAAETPQRRNGEKRTAIRSTSPLCVVKDHLSYWLVELDGKRYVQQPMQSCRKSSMKANEKNTCYPCLNPVVIEKRNYVTFQTCLRPFSAHCILTIVNHCDLNASPWSPCPLLR
jgi:hypothetical protein